MDKINHKAKGNYKPHTVQQRHTARSDDSITLPIKFRPEWLQDLDRRSLVYVQLQKNLKTIFSDMGGKANLSHVQISLAQRYVFSEWMLIGVELLIAEAPSKNSYLISKYISLTKNLCVLADKIGITRSSRAVLNLKDYVKTKGKK